MTRPSSNADQRLIQAAQEMLKHSGLDRMNLRQLCAKAKVNPGMFHYHFKTKDQFARAVLQDVYEKFFKDFSLRIEEEEATLGKLGQALFALGRFSSDNRQMFLSLFHDSLGQNKVVHEFVKGNFKRHGFVVLDLIQKCQKEGSLEKINKFEVMAFLMGSVNAAGMVIGLLEYVEQNVFAKGFLKGAQILLLSDQALQRRVDMALKGLGAKG
jgi:AcrR family transcriptional regulator